MEKHSNDVKNSAFKGYLLILIAGILWGTGGYWVIQLNSFGVGPAMTAFTAHVMALIPIGTTILIKHGTAGFKISKRGLIYAVILGVFAKALFKVAYDATTIDLGQSTASVILYTSPIFVTAMSLLLLKSKVHWNTYLALALNLIGVVLVVTGGKFREFNASTLGITLGVLAAFMYALNTVIGSMAGDTDNPLTTSFYMMLTSSMILFIVARPWTAKNLALLSNDKFMFWAIINSVLTAGFPNMLYMSGLSHDVEAPKAGILTSVEVIVATLMGVILLKENMNVWSILGFIIMLGSIVLLNSKVEQTE